MEYGGGEKRPVLIRHFHNHSDYNEHPLRKIYGNIFYRSATMIGCSESVTNSIKRDFPKIDVRCVNNAISFSRLDEYEVIGLDQGISVMMFGADFERKGVDITYIVRYSVEGTRTKHELWNEVVYTISFYGVSVLWFLSALTIGLAFVLLIGQKSEKFYLLCGGALISSEQFVQSWCCSLNLKA